MCLDPHYLQVWRAAALTCTSALMLGAACADPFDPAGGQAAVSYAKGGGSSGGSGGPSSGPELIRGDLVLGAADAPALVSTCPANPTSGSSGWVVVYRDSGCLIVNILPPFWVGSSAPYPLTDDLILNVQIEKGKNGRITHIRLAGQDVAGPDGIWHNTDWVTLDEPVVPSTAGFTLHVHTRNLAVWRTDSHLAGGKRVEIIGYVSIGDIIYPKQ